MKKYKLLKDLPNLKAGAIFEQVPADLEECKKICDRLANECFHDNSYYYCVVNFNYILVWNKQDYFAPEPGAKFRINIDIASF